MLRTDLRYIAREPQLMRAKSQVAPRSQHHVRVRRKIGDESCHMSESIVTELVSVVDDDDDGIVLLVQLCQNALDGAGTAEARRRGGRLDCTEHCEQSEPETLFVLLAPGRDKRHAMCAM